MEFEVYKEWQSLYTSKLSNVWLNERKELRRAAIIMCVLQEEFERVYQSIDCDMGNLRKKLEFKDSHNAETLLHNKQHGPCKGISPEVLQNQKANLQHLDTVDIQPLPLKNTSISKITTNIESPEIFDLNSSDGSQELFRKTPTNPKKEAEIIINCIETQNNKSPKINRSRKVARLNKIKTAVSPSLLDVSKESYKISFKIPDVSPVNTRFKKLNGQETSVIENTPELKHPFKKSKLVKMAGLKLIEKRSERRRNKKNSTLTQFFGNVASSTEDNFNTSDAEKNNFNTLLESARKSEANDCTISNTSLIKGNVELSTISHNSRISSLTLADETYCPFAEALEIDGDAMDVDAAIMETIGSSRKSNSSLDTVDNTILEEKVEKPVSSFMPDYDKIPEKKRFSPKYIYKPKPVRGKAERMKLKGWSCRDCQKYYEAMDLSPKKLQEKMDRCSRHRSKFAPDLDETRPEAKRQAIHQGFWDLTGLTQDTESTQ